MNILPKPSKYEALSGSLPIPSPIQIVADPHLRTVADYFVGEAAARGFMPRVEQSDDPDALIQLRTASGAGGLKSTDEAYELHVSDSHVTIEARSQSGVFSGVQTLLQMLEDSPGEIPCVAISDRPRYRWRGMHLDVCRHFFDKTFIKRYLDLLAMHKFNTFHWHLTEDQGWRLQIDRYPKLTEIGAWRERASGEYGGFYTQDDVRDILEYAAQRCITVVPEIEMPGHAMAALAAYPELSCTGGPFKVQTEWGIFDDVFCAGNEGTFEFLQNVLTEVIGLFPGEYVHIGGDECPKSRWKSCPKCQRRIETEGLRNEDHLQSWFVTRISYFLRECGRRLIGWDEILEGGLPPEAAVMSWRGVARGIEAARQGHDVVMTPTTHCYFDFKQADRDEEPVAHGVNTLQNTYAFCPTPRELTPGEASHVLGGQGNVWTERMATPQQVEYMVLPRMCALAEAVWSPDDVRDWSDFQQRLDRHLVLLDRLGYHYRNNSTQ